MQLILVLHNIRSTYNVGAILRTAEGFGVEKVIFSGYTPTPLTAKSVNHLSEIYPHPPSSLLALNSKVKHKLNPAANPETPANPIVLPHIAAKLHKQIEKTALGAERLLDCIYTPDITLMLEELKRLRYSVVGLENNLDDPRLHQLDEAGLQKLLGKRIALVLGEEVLGLSPALRAQMSYFLEIPMRGQKESFNVSVAAGIALYKLLVELG